MMTNWFHISSPFHICAGYLAVSHCWLAITHRSDADSASWPVIKEHHENKAHITTIQDNGLQRYLHYRTAICAGLLLTKQMNVERCLIWVWFNWRWPACVYLSIEWGPHIRFCPQYRRRYFCGCFPTAFLNSLCDGCCIYYLFKVIIGWLITRNITTWHEICDGLKKAL